MRIPKTSRANVRRAKAEAGFSIIEMLLATAILAIALLGNVSTSLTASHMGTMTRSRSDALRFADQFLERLRSDDDFAALYGRLDDLQMAAKHGTTSGVTTGGGDATGGGAYESEGTYAGGESISTTSADVITFNNGDRALPLTTYFPDFHEPDWEGAIGVLVEIPGAGTDAANPGVLREDVVDPRFALPFDLNGDGVVDSDSRVGDFIALPVLVRFRVALKGARHPYELTVSTWIRGTR